MIQQVLNYLHNFSLNKDNEYDEYDTFVDEREYDNDYSDSFLPEEDEEQEERSLRLFKQPTKARIVKRDDINSVRMQIIKPTSYDESSDIIMLLKERQSVVMNLEFVSKEEGRRIIDTVSGGVTALDGKIVKVTNTIFIAAPYNYQIRSESENRRKSNFSFR